MTTADRLLHKWTNRVRTYPVRALARSLDPDVRTIESYNPRVTSYIFTDGSIIITRGRGTNFRILVSPHITEPHT